MKRISIEKANDEAKKTLKAFEEAVENYKEKAKRYIYMGPIILGKPMPKPEALLNFAAFQEIDRAWRKLEHVDGRLRQAYIQLALTHYTHFVRDDGAKQD